MVNAFSSAAMIECRATGVGIDRGPRLATVDAQLLAGRFTAILGPNGAGKSTLMSMLVGERAPQAGEVWLDGLPVHRHAAQALATRRAVMPQDCAVAFDFSVPEVVELGRYPHRNRPSRHEADIAPQAMALTGVAHLARRSINTLSGGERARAHLARALAQIWEAPEDGSARWLLLDEPTAALDLAHQHQSMSLLRRWALEQGVGVVAVLHDLNLALRYADDVLVLGDPGKSCSVAWGQTLQTLQPELVQSVWGMRCDKAYGSDGALQYLFSGLR